MDFSSFISGLVKGVTSQSQNTAQNMANQTASALTAKVKSGSSKAIDELGKKIGNKAASAMYKKKDITFKKIPMTLNEVLEVEGSDLKDPFMTAALAIVALNAYANNKQNGIEIFEYINGPEDMTNLEKQRFDMAMDVKPYIARTYFKGATPENDYTPTEPYTIHISEDAYSHKDKGYCKLYITCGGADSARPVLMRQKGDKWYIWQTQGQLVSDVRLPKSDDKWA